jgi:hypothetical protein
MKPLYKDVTNEVESGYNNNTLGLGGSDTFKYNRWAWGLGVDFHF